MESSRPRSVQDKRHIPRGVPQRRRSLRSLRWRTGYVPRRNARYPCNVGAAGGRAESRVCGGAACGGRGGERGGAFDGTDAPSACRTGGAAQREEAGGARVGEQLEVLEALQLRLARELSRVPPSACSRRWGLGRDSARAAYSRANLAHIRQSRLICIGIPIGIPPAPPDPERMWHISVKARFGPWRSDESPPDL